MSRWLCGDEHGVLATDWCGEKGYYLSATGNEKETDSHNNTMSPKTSTKRKVVQTDGRTLSVVNEMVFCSRENLPWRMIALHREPMAELMNSNSSKVLLSVEVRPQCVMCRYIYNWNIKNHRLELTLVDLHPGCL